MIVGTNSSGASGSRSVLRYSFHESGHVFKSVKNGNKCDSKFVTVRWYKAFLSVSALFSDIHNSKECNRSGLAPLVNISGRDRDGLFV